MQRRVMDASMPEWFKMLSHNKPVIYVSVGGAAGHGGSVTFFRKVFQAFKDSEWQVIVSTGGEVDLSCLEPVPSNMRVVNWVPGQEMIARSDLVVFHGGYTRVQILMQGRPSVIIPFHSEQEYYGRLMEKAGVARIVHYSDEPYHCYRRRWKGGNRWITSKQFTVHIRLNATLKPEILRTAVAECMRDSEMRIQARALGAELESHGGCDMIINMIRSRLS